MPNPTHLSPLQQSRLEFIKIAQVSSDWVWEIDEKGLYTYVSDKIKDFLGYVPDEILGKTPFDFMRPDEAMRLQKIFGAYLIDPKPFRDLENINLHKNGEVVILSTSGFPVFDEEGKFCGYRGSDRDITKLKHLISKLRQSEYNLKQAQRVAHIGHWELDLLTNKLFWSDEVYRIFGAEPQSFEATYEAFLSFVPIEDHETVHNAYTNSIINKTAYHVTHKILTKQKKLKYVEERCEHILDSNGNVIKSIGTVHDITQKILKDKQIYLASSVFEYSTDAIVITSDKNKIVAVNRAFTQLTGYTREEAIGKNPRVLSSGWGDKGFYQKMWSDIVKKGLWQGEIWDRKKDGTLYTADQSIIAIRNDFGKIENFIGISHDITHAKSQQEQITKLAFYDFLTKLPNRKFCKEQVEDRIKSLHHNPSTFALLFLDLDNFKWVNDTLGHKIGDKVLLYVAKDIQSVLHEDCIVGRLGGDEFVVLIPYHDLLLVSKIAQKIIDRIKEPISIDHYTINIGWSIGISLYPDNGDNYDDLLKNADLAMYGAKGSGKNNYVYFNDEMNDNAHKRMQLHNALKQALKNGDFYLVYQPKIDCKMERIVGAEVLLRWESQELGVVDPTVFIPVAEESGLIVELGYWVFEQVFRDTQRLLKLGFKDFTIAINVSVVQLEKQDLIEKIMKLIEYYKLETKYFEIEVTESGLMSNIAKLDRVIACFVQHGFSVAIDDFGTGYSSLQYLNKLSFNTLKIDKSFIDDIETKGRVIAQAIMGLSKTLGFVSVAEGVETQRQVEILREMGCDIIQGYLYSKPLVLEDFIEYFRDCTIRFEQIQE